MQRSVVIDESQFEEIRCRWVKVSLQVALAGISEVCMIMELSYLRRLHTPTATLSVALCSTHSHTLPPAPFILKSESFLLARPLCHIGSGLSQKRLVIQTLLLLSSLT